MSVPRSVSLPPPLPSSLSAAPQPLQALQCRPQQPLAGRGQRPDQVLRGPQQGPRPPEELQLRRHPGPGAARQPPAVQVWLLAAALRGLRLGQTGPKQSLPQYLGGRGGRGGGQQSASLPSRGDVQGEATCKDWGRHVFQHVVSSLTKLWPAHLSRLAPWHWLWLWLLLAYFSFFIIFIIKIFHQIETNSCPGISPRGLWQPADPGWPDQICQQESPPQLYSEETQGKTRLITGTAGILIYHFQTQSKLVSFFEGRPTAPWDLRQREHNNLSASRDVSADFVLLFSPSQHKSQHNASLKQNYKFFNIVPYNESLNRKLHLMFTLTFLTFSFLDLNLFQNRPHTNK